jgi:hypothetical protein
VIFHFATLVRNSSQPIEGYLIEHINRFLTNKPSKNEIQLWTGLIATAMIAMFIGSNQFNEALPHAVKGPEPQVQ